MRSVRRLWLSLIGLAAPGIAQARSAPAPPASLEAEFRRDRPIVEAFLADRTGTALVLSYRWLPGVREWPQNISRARFFELIAPCAVREISYSIVVTSTRVGPPPPAAYDGVDVYWTCTGSNAVAPRLRAHFDRSLMGVDLMPDPATG
jgi:hypothetical protein